MNATDEKRIANQFLAVIGVAGFCIGALAIAFAGRRLYPNTPLTHIMIFSLGITLFPSALVLLLYEVFFRHLASTRLRKELVEEVKGTFTPLAELDKSGLRAVYLHRGGLPEKLGELLRMPGVRSVRFCGIQTSLAQAIPDFDAIVEGCLQSGATLQFLFMERDAGTCDFYAQRERDEHCDNARDGEILKKAAQHTINHLLALASRTPNGRDNLQVREYFAFPYLSLVQIERVIFVGPYLFSTACADMPMFCVEDNGREECVFRKFERHFARLWDAARPVTTASVGTSRV